MKQRLIALVSQFTWLDWVLVSVFVVSCLYLAIFGWTRLHQRVVPMEYVASAVAVGEPILVDVSGAVVSAGVFRLAPGSRVKDALVAAGGVTEEADREFLSQVVNQAEKLTDGQKIFIPKVSGGNEGEPGESPRGINVNKASLAELVTLPGVGEARARKIIENRPYVAPDDLVTRKILPGSVWDQVKGLVSTY